MRNLILFSFLLIFSAAMLHATNHTNSHYAFTIKVISGTHKGKVFYGKFSVRQPANFGEHTFEVESIRFNYLDTEYDRKGFDSIPKARFVNGQFKDLYFTGGPQKKRFGLNQGFERRQFNRPSESFVQAGKSYFGYLNPATYVDGVGTIEYKRLP